VHRSFHEKIQSNKCFWKSDYQFSANLPQANVFYKAHGIEIAFKTFFHFLGLRSFFSQK